MRSETGLPLYFGGPSGPAFFVLIRVELLNPLLSIIVPVLNEAAALPSFLTMLERQEGLCFEVLLCDGGSTDSSAATVRKLQEQLSFGCRWIPAPAGRAAQMNRGAELAKGAYFLFLHVDSLFVERSALAAGIAALRDYSADQLVGGHFRLAFGEAPETMKKDLNYWEIKARLNREGCTHGDQGLVLSRRSFAATRGFPEDWPLFEDTRLAETVRRQGGWLLLPATLVTSARRFVSEGLEQRQILNALLMNFSAIGWVETFSEAGAIYRQQSETGVLPLGTFLLKFRAMLKSYPWARQLKIWYGTGRYVRSNAWQLLFALRVRRGTWTAATDHAQIESSLTCFDRQFDRISCNPLGFCLAAVLTWCWFRWQLLRESFFHDSSGT